MYSPLFSAVSLTTLIPTLMVNSLILFLIVEIISSEIFWSFDGNSSSFSIPIVIIPPFALANPTHSLAKP